MKKRRKKIIGEIIILKEYFLREERLNPIYHHKIAKNPQNSKQPLLMKVTLFNSKFNWTNQVRYLII